MTTYAEVRVDISATPIDTTLGDVVQLDVTAFVSGDSQLVGELLIEDIPGMQDFSISGSSQSIHMFTSIVDGKTIIEQGTTYSYFLVPEASGSYMI